MGLAETVIWPEVQPAFSFCPILLPFLSQLLMPSKLLNKNLPEKLCLSVCFLKNRPVVYADSIVERIYVERMYASQETII